MSRPNSDRSNTETFKQPKSRNRRYFVLGFLVSVALLVLFAPSILVNTPLKQTALDYAFSDVDGDVKVGKISVGWFSPVQFDDIHITDNTGREVISIESLTTSNRLLSFLRSDDLGTIEILRPALDVVLRPDGSNIEDIFANYINAPATDSANAIPKVQIKIVDGIAQLGSDSLPQTAVVEKFNALVNCMTGAAPLSVELRCDVTTSEDPAGTLMATILTDQGSESLTGEAVSADLQTEQLPLGVLAPIVTRIIGPFNCGGSLDSELTFQYQSDVETITVDITKLDGKQIAIVAPDYLDKDQLAAHHVTASGKIQLNSQNVTAQQFKIESDFARATAHGQFDVSQLIHFANGQKIPQSNFQLDGAVDLAQLVTMLPNTTRIREGVAMKSGVLTFSANTRDENQTQRMVLNAEAINMQFNVNGQNIVWQHPLRAVCVAGETNGELSLENVQLQSDFLNLAGDAALDHGNLQVDGDLAKVMTQIGQVVDTGGLNLGGRLRGKLQWKKNDVNTPVAQYAFPVQIQADFKITEPVFEYPGMNTWRENELDLVIGADGVTDSEGRLSIQNGNFEVQIGDEHAQGILANPIENVFAENKFQFKCQADGSIAKWMAQARNFSEFPEFFMDGNLHSQFLLTVNRESIRLNQIQFDAIDFKFNGFALNIQEPKVNGRANLKYDLVTGNALFTKSRINSSAIAINTDELLFTLSDKILADGVATFRGNANRVSQWIGLSLPNDSVRWDGTLIGKLTLDSESNFFGGELAGKVTDLVFVQPMVAESTSQPMQPVSHQTSYSEFWREPDLRLVSTFMLSDDFNAVQIRQLNIKSKTADVQAAGTISELATNMLADLSGQWNVKWENVNQTIQEMAGDVLKFRGQGWQPIEISGPLYDANANYAWIPDQLKVNADLNWQQASIFDLPLGSSQVGIRMSDSLANLSTNNDANLVDKLFRLQPRIDLRQPDPLLTMGQGTLLEQWSVSAEDSRTWLKYAAPLVADATSANGQLTANIDGASVPLFNPMNASAQGALEIHQLNIGPGPLAQQFLPLIDQILAVTKVGDAKLQSRSSWMQLKPQRLPFAVQQGRVHHDGFEMNYKDVVVRTRGSVGFDQSLNMVAEIPILESWVGNDKIMKRLIGKSISIPVTGTLAQPRLDRRSITQLIQQLVRESAVGAVNEKVASEVGEFKEKANDKIQGELNRFQNKVNDKIKTELEDKVQNELQNGINKLFGNRKK